jgi:hypothetical protein
VGQPVPVVEPPSQSQVQVEPAGHEQAQPGPASLPTPHGSPSGWQTPLQSASPAGQPVPWPPSQTQAQFGSLSGQAQVQPTPASGFAPQTAAQAEVSGMQLPTPPQPQNDSPAGQQTAAGAVPLGSAGQLTTQLVPFATQLPLPLPQPQKYSPEGQQPGGGLPASATAQTCGQAWVSAMQEPWPLQPQKYSLAGQHTETGVGVGPASTIEGAPVPASQSQVQVGSLAGQEQPQGVPPLLPPEGWAGQFTTQVVVSGTQLPVPLPQPQRYWPAGQQPPLPPPLQVHWPFAPQTGCWSKAQGGKGPVQPEPQVHWPFDWQTGCWSEGQGGRAPVQLERQIAGHAVPEGMQMPLPLQPQKDSPAGQAVAEPEAQPKRVKLAAVKDTVPALASMVRSALPIVTEGTLLESLSTPTTLSVSVAVPLV